MEAVKTNVSAKCPDCGIPTIPDRDGLTYEEMLCDRCAAGADPMDSRCDHEWVYTGTQYGGEDESYRGEGRVYCSKCGADGDA